MRLIILLFINYLPIANSSVSKDLSGEWYSNNGHEYPFNLVTVGGTTYNHGETKYVYPDGRLAYIGTQSSKLNLSGDGSSIVGTSDFFDSRGCSYTNMPITGTLRDEDTIHLVIDIPRYAYVTTTRSRRVRRHMPTYCYTNTPYRRRYICGTRWQTTSVKYECRLLNVIKSTEILRRY